MVADGYNMDGIKAIFAEADEMMKEAMKEEVTKLIEYSIELQFTADLDEENMSTVFYYAGYISKSLLRNVVIAFKPLQQNQSRFPRT